MEKGSFTTPDHLNSGSIPDASTCAEMREEPSGDKISR